MSRESLFYWFAFELDRMIERIEKEEDTELVILCLPQLDQARKRLDRIQATPPIAKAKQKKDNTL